MFVLVLIVHLSGSLIADPQVYFFESEGQCVRTLPTAIRIAKQVPGYKSHAAMCVQLQREDA